MRKRHSVASSKGEQRTKQKSLTRFEERARLSTPFRFCISRIFLMSLASDRIHIDNKIQQRDNLNQNRSRSQVLIKIHKTPCQNFQNVYAIPWLEFHFNTCQWRERGKTRFEKDCAFCKSNSRDSERSARESAAPRHLQIGPNLLRSKSPKGFRSVSYVNCLAASASCTQARADQANNHEDKLCWSSLMNGHDQDCLRRNHCATTSRSLPNSAIGKIFSNHCRNASLKTSNLGS